MYTLPLLSKSLAEIAEKYLPKFSGQEKVLQVLIRFDYIPSGQKMPEGITESSVQHIKVVFWHPNNAMLVGYNFETLIENIFDTYIISANHSSTWKADGLNFFHEILEEPSAFEIIEAKLINVVSGSAECKVSPGIEIDYAEFQHEKMQIDTADVHSEEFVFEVEDECELDIEEFR